VSLWGALRAAGWIAAEAAETGAGGSGAGEEEAAPTVGVVPREASAAASARAARAASAARAAAVAAAAEAAARGPPREISKLSERLLSQLRLRGRGGVRVAVVAPSADDCMLWRVEAEAEVERDFEGEFEERRVALVALSPPENASSNSPVVALGLASVELSAAEERRRRRGRDGATEELSFRGLVSAGDGDDELEALAAAVREALLRGPRAGGGGPPAARGSPPPLSQL